MTHGKELQGPSFESAVTYSSLGPTWKHGRPYLWARDVFLLLSDLKLTSRYRDENPTFGLITSLLWFHPPTS